MTTHRESALLALSLLAIFTFASFVATSVFNSYPYSMDEYSVMVQAQIFAEGSLSKVATPLGRIIAEKWMIVEGDKIFSKYPPALAALLTIPLRLGVPQLLNPLLSTVTAFLIFRISYLHFGSRTAWITLAILGTSPYFYPYAASFFPQPFALCAASFCLFLLSGHISRPSLPRCFIMGATTGALFLGRQLDAACLAVVMTLAVMRTTPRPHKAKAFSTFIAGCAPGLATLFLYNYLQSGKVSISTFSAWNRDFAIAPAISGSVWSSCLRVLSNYVDWFFTYTVRSFYWDLLPYVGAPLFSLFVIGLITMRSSATRWAAAFILLVVGAYIMHPSAGWAQYGQRYWYVCFGAFLFIAAQGVSTLQGFTSPRSRLAFYAILFGTQIVALTTSLSAFERRFELQEALWRDISRTCPDKTIVVLKKPPLLNIDAIQFFVDTDFKRNSPQFGERFIVMETDRIDQLRQLLPSFPICVYDFRGGNLKGSLPGFPPNDRLSIVR